MQQKVTIRLIPETASKSGYLLLGIDHDVQGVSSILMICVALFTG